MIQTKTIFETLKKQIDESGCDEGSTALLAVSFRWLDACGIHECSLAEGVSLRNHVFGALRDYRPNCKPDTLHMREALDRWFWTEFGVGLEDIETVVPQKEYTETLPSLVRRWRDEREQI